MSTLHQRLGDLADLGAPGAATDPREPAVAWQRGLRYRRRRRLGTAAIVVLALALLAGLGGTAWLRGDSDIAPAGNSAPAGLPDRFYEPSPWLAGTDDEGPLGQLSALIPAERKGWGGGAPSPQPVGISATTGEYRFLDLPDHTEGFALSPDGQQVAYWTTGAVTGTPNTDEGRSPTGGVAVYNSITGEVHRSPLESEHGLLVDGLRWADDETLLLGYSTYLVGDEARESPLGSGQATTPRWYVWSGGDSAPTEDERLTRRGGVEATAGGYALIDRDVVEVAGGAQRRVRAYSTVLDGTTALDPTGTQVALPGAEGGHQRSPSTLRIVGTDGSSHVVPRSQRTYEAIAWSDPTHVATLATLSPGDAFRDAVVLIIDVEDGTRRLLLETNGVQGFDLATDLLSENSITAVEPPRPLDPRWLAGGLVGIVILAGFALLRWRRRVEV